MQFEGRAHKPYTYSPDVSFFDHNGIERAELSPAVDNDLIIWNALMRSRIVYTAL